MKTLTKFYLGSKSLIIILGLAVSLSACAPELQMSHIVEYEEDM